MTNTNQTESRNLRSAQDREQLFATPETLWQAACKYFEWCSANPVVEYKGSGRKRARKAVPKKRAFTLPGLCQYLNCDMDWFNRFRQSHEGKTEEASIGFASVISRMQQVIDKQNFSAAEGFSDGGLVNGQRDIGKKEEEHIEEKKKGPLIKWGENWIQLEAHPESKCRIKWGENWIDV